MRNWIAFGISAAVLSLTANAEAQSTDRRNFDANRLRPAMDRDGIISVESATALEHLKWDASLWYNYANDAVVLNEGDDRVASLLKNRHDLNAVLSLGLFDFLQVGLDLPFTVNQRRGGRALNVLGLEEVEATGVGDLAITPKLRLLSQKRSGLNLAVLSRINFSTSSPRGNYLGERRGAVVPEVALSRSFGPWTLGTNVAALFRKNLRSSELNANIEHELIVRGGAALDLRKLDTQIPVKLNLALEAFTQLREPFDRGNLGGAEWLASADVDVARNVSVFLGGGTALSAGYSIPDWRAFGGLRLFRGSEPEPEDRDGDGIADTVDQCPDTPEDPDGYEDSDGCADPDNDGDGIPDQADGAPNEPEDKDGFEDEDGVPDPDNDGDGILDADDQCPSEGEDDDGFEDDDGCVDPDNDKDGVLDVNDLAPNDPEDPDGFEDGDGAPDPDNDGDGVADVNDNCPMVAGSPENAGCKKPQLVVIRGCSFDLTEKVYFRTARATIESRSYSLLDNIAELMKAQPQIERIRVEGHTDSRGSAAGNKRLSQARAEAVVAYLVKAGVAAERLEAVGFGEEKPIDSNATSKGREANRRVEIVIADCNVETETR